MGDFSDLYMPGPMEQRPMRERLRFMVLCEQAYLTDVARLTPHGFLPAIRLASSRTTDIMSQYDDRLAKAKCRTALICQAAVEFGLPARMVLEDARARGFWFGDWLN